MGNLRTAGRLFPNAAPAGSVGCGRRQDQAVQWVILQSAALAVVLVVAPVVVR